MARRGLEQISRKDRERARHRREILDAAERIFARNGYHATTVEAVAKEAEFAVGTLYKFFKGKEDIYTHVVESFFRDFKQQFETSVTSIEDPEQAIAALIELRLTFSEEHRRFLRVLLETYPGSRADPSRLFPPSVMGIYDEYIQAVREIFGRGIERGTFDEADPLYLALCLEGIINAFVAYWSKNEPTEPLAERIGKMRREFLGRIKIRLDSKPQRRRATS